MTENQSKYQKRRASFRDEMKKRELNGFILPRTDEFQGEFLAEYAERLQWLSGFTGSAGSAIILEDKAVVMSDGRYTIQLKQQVDSELYGTEDSTKTTIGVWLAEHACKGMRIGYDVWLHTPKQIEKIIECIDGLGITLVPVEENIVDAVWNDQPPKPMAQVSIFPDEIAGRSSKQKRGDIADVINGQGAQSCLITAGDSICWLLNIRGGDIEFSPLVLSYVILYVDGTVDWFVDADKVSKDICAALGRGIRILPFADMEDRIAKMVGSVLFDQLSAPIWFEQTFTRNDIDMVAQKDPCTLLKARKSKTEQEAIKRAHIHDGVAVVKFLKWLDEAVGTEKLTELSVEAKLEDFRKEHPDYLYPSFSTIAGFAGNGAVIHYRATQETSKEITGDGLLLVDSGGQYRWGTTDITRTICIGTPTQEMKENYTRVLKGHIAVANARFEKGVTGKEIDALARKPLQDVGLDYAHGTGHGVGCFLCVHEAAANISMREEKVIEAGMLLSNEPGYYKENEYGIRIETLILAQECTDDAGYLYFETVTLSPYDTRLIDVSLLDERECIWLGYYAQSVELGLSPYLSDSEKAWLRNAMS